MSDEIIATPICPACSAELPAGVEKCPKCGRVLTESENDTSNLRGDERLMRIQSRTLFLSLLVIAVGVWYSYWHLMGSSRTLSFALWGTPVIAPLSAGGVTAYYSYSRKRGLAESLFIGLIVAICTFIACFMMCAASLSNEFKRP